MLDIEQILHVRESRGDHSSFFSILLQNYYLRLGDQPSIADLSAVCEISQLKVLGDEYSSKYLAKRPNLSSWMERMEAVEGYSDVHSLVRRVIEKIKSENEAKAKL